MPIIGIQASAITRNLGLLVDYLVVAGGGSGGNNIAGGGGAGGYRASTLSLAFNNTFTVTVGGGGAINTTQQDRGISGSNSVFSTITATGGGAGGGNSATALTGGSGGGGTGNNGTGASGNAGSYSPSEGNSGGNGQATNFASAGGGGGSSANGTAGSTSANTGGEGGNGTANSISGTSVTYAGGGGGGRAVLGTSSAASGGAGGGGNGGWSNSSPNTANNNNTAGSANTGGGGGGAAWGSAELGKQGGSGIVIASYSGTQKAFGGTVTTSGGNTIHTFTSSGFFVTTQLPTGMMLWLDGSDSATITQSSNLISQWLDKSGNNYNFTASGSARPTLTASGLNGKSVVTFDGSANAMLGTNTTGANATSWSLFMVARGNTSSTQTVIAKRGGNSAGDDNFGAGYYSSKSYTRGRNLSGASNATILDASNQLWIMQSSGSNGLTGSAQLSSTIMVNNSSVTTYFNQANAASATAGSQAITGAGQISIGNLQQSGTVELLNGYIAEIILYPSALGTTDRQTVETYLKSKWNI